MEQAEVLSQIPDEWNSAYFALLARGLADADEATAERLTLEPLASLPDQSFFDAAAVFQRSVDETFFNGLGIETAVAVHIRSRLAGRLKASSEWSWLVRQRTTALEMRFGQAVATLLFNQYSHLQSAKAYLLPPAIDRLLPFLPSLEALAAEGASIPAAIFTLNLLEVSPRAAHLPYLLTVVRAWMEVFPNATEFWIDHSIGRRVCGLINTIHREEPGTLGGSRSLREQASYLVAALIRLGVAEAARLEESLANSN